MIKIAVIGNDDVMRCLVVSHMLQQPDMEVLFTSETLGDTVDSINCNGPQVLICCLLHTGTDVIRRICRIARANQHIGIVCIGTNCQDSYLMELFRSRVRSFVPFDAPSEELITAIHEAGKGRRFLPQKIYDRMLDTFLDQDPSNSKLIEGDSDPYDKLTSRESEVIQLSVESHTCREIAEQLCISTRTVETHRSNAMRKLGITSRIELLRYAISRGMLSVQ